MRVVARPEDLDDALAAARREARAGFGDDRVFIERFLGRARHLEVQVIADVHGTVLHLGERECSLQRRHQKVIEESPSPVVSPQLRERLGEEAVALARAAGYVNAGTVEFIADFDDPSEHYFLECNARLQVEHPVTELVTGLDLVELQLRVAAGDPLPIAQADVVIRGHAIEARINAEDAARDFLPSAGRVLAYRPPRQDGRVRVDDAIETGSEIDTAYDSLIAKVIAHGEDRASAISRLDHALARTVVLGVTTTTGYLRSLLANDDVRAGRLDTELIGRLPASEPPFGDAQVARTAALIGLAQRHEQRSDDPFDRADGWRLGGSRARSWWRLAVGGGAPVDLALDDIGRSELARTGPHTWAVTADGDRREWSHAADGAIVWVGCEGHAWPVRPAPTSAAAQTGGDGELRAPMPGQVLIVHAAPGDMLSAGDPVVVLESMKMELVLTSPVDGELAELGVAVGDKVAVDQKLARVEASADS
jgi:acetyl-CoA/propionyl-CoA carboxylase biotin carboxyl carrier protein